MSGSTNTTTSTPTQPSELYPYIFHFLKNNGFKRSMKAFRKESKNLYKANYKPEYSLVNMYDILVKQKSVDTVKSEVEFEDSSKNKKKETVAGKKKDAKKNSLATSEDSSKKKGAVPEKKDAKKKSLASSEETPKKKGAVLEKKKGDPKKKGRKKSSSTSTSSSSSEKDKKDTKKDTKKGTQKKANGSGAEKKKDAGTMKTSSTSSSSSSEEDKSKKGKNAQSKKDNKSKTAKKEMPAPDTKSSKKRPREDDNTDEGPVKKKKNSAPFRRIEAEKIQIRNGLEDNSFEGKFGDSWGEKANRDLKFVSGDRFRHEKTKKKRGGYRGGKIDAFSVNSITLEDND